MRRPSTTLLLAMTAALAVAACGARTSLDTSGLEGDASPGENAPDRCVQCLTLACDDLYVQCDQESSCQAIQTCAEAARGDDSACLCSASASAAGPYLALGRCIQGAACGAGGCASVCQDHDAGYPVASRCDAVVSVPSCLGGSPDAGATGARSSTAACEACVAQSCGGFSSACGEATPCQGYLACLATCRESGCVVVCEALHAAGESAADALDVCLGANCESACGF
jgi:hypothetical protein